MPSLAVQRPYPGVVPLPHAVADDWGNVIGNVHSVAGTCSGSGSGWVGAGRTCGSSIGSSSGSTTTVRTVSPICMRCPLFFSILAEDAAQQLFLRGVSAPLEESLGSPFR